MQRTPRAQVYGFESALSGEGCDGALPYQSGVICAFGCAGDATPTGPQFTYCVGGKIYGCTSSDHAPQFAAF